VTLERVLVANRGEIALRVIEACRELGIDSIAAYSRADARMPYLKLASKSVCIGPADARRSYLSIPALISAAEVTGAQAVHPGYGFLSESPEFAEVVEEHGLIFVGPGRDVMRLVGDKLAARAAVAAAGVPVLPGERLPDGENDLKAAAERVGYPLLLKAVFGGGGRGMRLVEGPDGLRVAAQSAATEARKAFGDGSLYLERALLNPRHIEVQVLADREGRVAHLGTRDCSIQRRHQKLVEEAPAPNLDPALRARIHEAALRSAQAVGLTNLGTVEFLLDPRGTFYFIEINARIQVEHPITEVLYGTNLVREQLLLAAGLPLDPAVADASPSGHAIECRINAEDPKRHFLPSSGRLRVAELPGGHGIRVDTHLHHGMVVSPHYDSLLAKVIAWGRDREEARVRMVTALERFRVSGVSTTRPLVQEVVSHPAFCEGRTGTDFVDRLFSAG